LPTARSYAAPSVHGMTASGAPLLVTRDPDLLDYLRRLSVAAGRDPDVAPGPAQARRWWPTAPVVVVGDDVLPDLAGAALPRRAGVVAVARGDDVPWDDALAAGADRVVHLATDDHALLRALSASAPSASPGRVVGVVGGSGGAGASVLAAALGIAAGRAGVDALVVDADPGSGGLDLALGAEDVGGARWSDLAAVTGLLAPEALRSALPSVHGAAVLSVDRESVEPVPLDAVPAVLDSARDAFDLVVVDLPRARRDVLDLVLPRCDRVLLVSTTDVRGAAAARRLAQELDGRAALGLVVRSVPHGLLEPDEVQAWVGVPVAAEVRHDGRLAAAVERGDPPGAAPRTRLARTCLALVRGLVA
jgi:secretion/DNA translocation related CpaE-like protein